MKFIDQYQQVKGVFDLTKDRVYIPESQVRIENLDFTSHFDLPSGYSHHLNDSCIGENIRFRYPVFIPHQKAKVNEVILLLHGLNERAWDKHLAGAKLLCEKTGKAVLLFPLSFHINRGLPEWSDSRKMAGLLDLRRKKFPQVKDSTLVNLALSQRLTDQPERFLISGIQSLQDITDLMKMIRSGEHPLFEKDAQVDLFAYSIGCMLLQALMASNPEHLLDRSRIVFFAGGSLFGYMQGISRYIMDSVAFAAIQRFYLNHFKPGEKKGTKLQHWAFEHPLSRYFSSTVAPHIAAKERDSTMHDFGNNLMVIALRDDQIMPLEGIRQAVGDHFFRSKRFKVLHFPYDYRHENPFPVLYRKIDDQVNDAFRMVYGLVTHFFSKQESAYACNRGFVNR